MEPAPDSPTLVIHTERITISDGRYLVYYTFTSSSETEDDGADEAE